MPRREKLTMPSSLTIQASKPEAGPTGDEAMSQLG